MNMRNLVTILGAAFILAACAQQPPPGPPGPPGSPGLLLGLVHGFILVFTLIGSLFTDVRVFAYPNAGFWYDLGFVVGAAFFFGGGTVSVRFTRHR